MPKFAVESVLSSGQKELIEASIGYLLDFPSDALALEKIVKLLRLATIEKKTSAEIPEEITQLIEILNCPTRFLFRLEQLGQQPITVADAQKFILYLMTEKLEEAANKAQLLLDWPEEQVYTAIILSDAEKTLFVSDKPVESGPHIQDLSNDPEKIYFASWQLDEINRHVRLQVTVSIPNQPVITETRTLRDFNETIEVVRRACEIRTNMIAVEHALRYLVKRKVPGVHLELQKQIEDTPFFEQFLTDKIYLPLLAKRLIDIHELTSINASEYQNLFNPAVKSLVKSGVLSLNDAKNLTRSQCLVMSQPFYFALLSNQKLWLHNFSDVQPERSKVLSHPFIIQLQQTEKLKFEQARQVSVHILPLLSKQMYRDYFLKIPINLNLFKRLTKADSDLLVHEKTVALLKQQLITFDELFNASTQQLEQVIDENIHRLLLGKHISFAQLKTFSRKTITQIKTDNEYAHSIELGEVELIYSTQENSPMFFSSRNNLPRNISDARGDCSNYPAHY